MKFLDLSEEKIDCLNAEINEFSYDGCCRVYDFLTHDILSRFEIKEICENRHMIFFHGRRRKYVELQREFSRDSLCGACAR